MVARLFWILPMIMLVLHNSIRFMAKSGKRDLITQAKPLTYI